MLNKKALAAAVGVPAQYQIERSLRFNSADSTHLTRTPSSAGNRKTWTWSGWVKRANLGSDQIFFEVYNANNDNQTFNISWFSADSISIGAYNVFWLQTSAVYRDPSAWYHVVCAVDTTQATANNRIRLYVNGSEVTAFSTRNNPSQNADLAINQAAAHYLGSRNGTSLYLNGYMTEVHFVDGQQLTASSFGETDADTGIWKPKAFSGTYGTNGFYLDFSDNSGTTSTTLGKDYSGNSNNWTPNNFSVTAGTGNDSLVDTPTPYGTDTGAGGEVRGNYATLNPLDSDPGYTIRNGNLDISTQVVDGLARGTIFASSGKWYFEATMTTYNADTVIGVVNEKANPRSNWLGESENTLGYVADGRVYLDQQTVSNPIANYSSYTANDVIGIAFDVDSGKIWFAKNNTWQGSGDPAAGTNPTTTQTSWKLMTGAARTYGSGAFSINFGQRPFAYTAPSGYKALCTTNLPTPTIGATTTTRADDYFNTVLYTGNGSTQSITGVGFQPDFVWLKARTSGGSSFTNHVVVDAVRGAGANGYRNLYPNLTDAEVNPASDQVSVSALNSDGFSLGQNANTNTNTMTAVAWNWKANGAGSSNTAGTITSTVSANTTSGFSIATFTIQTSGSATVGHGLGVAPSLILVKTRNLAFQWDVYHASLGKDAYLVLNDNSAQVTGATTVWNSTAPTSTVFSLGSAWASAAPGNTAVAYCFAPVAGYSAFGSYTGNGSTDGPFIYTGFRPAYVLIKAASSVTYGNWILMDAKRSSFNVADDALYANLSNSEDTTYQLDMLSNGFKIRHSAFDGINGNTKTYIYAAFAENPFKYSLAR